jgi:hypothetical protein
LTPAQQRVKDEQDRWEQERQDKLEAEKRRREHEARIAAIRAGGKEGPFPDNPPGGVGGGGVGGGGAGGGGVGGGGVGGGGAGGGGVFNVPDNAELGRIPWDPRYDDPNYGQATYAMDYADGYTRGPGGYVSPTSKYDDPNYGQPKEMRYLKHTPDQKKQQNLINMHLGQLDSPKGRHLDPQQKEQTRSVLQSRMNSIIPQPVPAGQEEESSESRIQRAMANYEQYKDKPWILSKDGQPMLPQGYQEPPRDEDRRADAEIEFKKQLMTPQTDAEGNVTYPDPNEVNAKASVLAGTGGGVFNVNDSLNPQEPQQEFETFGNDGRRYPDMSENAANRLADKLNSQGRKAKVTKLVGKGGTGGSWGAYVTVDPIVAEEKEEKERKILSQRKFVDSNIDEIYDIMKADLNKDRDLALEPEKEPSRAAVYAKAREEYAQYKKDWKSEREKRKAVKSAEKWAEQEYGDWKSPSSGNADPGVGMYVPQNLTAEPTAPPATSSTSGPADDPFFEAKPLSQSQVRKNKTRTSALEKKAGDDVSKLTPEELAELVELYNRRGK